MLRTRLWMGTVLVVMAAGLLVVDQRLAPWFPFLFVMLLGLSLAGCFELLHMLEAARRPPAWLCYAGLIALLAANWLAHVPGTGQLLPEPWPWILGVFTALVLAAFLVEMAGFREPGQSVGRMALVLWIVCYLGLLPSFFAQLRWLKSAPGHGTAALGLAIFVPKVCDIGAYFTGRLLGRHKMAPVLSPKKTWEGAIGGLVWASAAAIGLDRLASGSCLRGEIAWEIAFGVSVGMVSMLGDLAESLIKRDCSQKDASQAVPGFGGVLDVADSVIFPAPLVYFWLVCLG